MIRDFATYRELLESLNSLTAAQLDQPVMAYPPEPDHFLPVRLIPAFALGTTGEFDPDREVRSAKDGRHDPDQVVLLIDHHPFGPKGEIAWELVPDGEDRPVYAKGHPDAPAEDAR